jgi:signal transduction histidine kinase
MQSAAVTVPETHGAFRDPVLVLPAIVAAGLAIGWLGTDAGISGPRVAADLALSWALVAASLVALERARWHRTRTLLTAAAFAVLAADLRWTSGHAMWTLGFLLGGLWVALIVQVVLTFPDGRPWSKAAKAAIVAAYAVALGGQLARALVLPDSRDVVSLAARHAVTDADAAELIQALLALAVAMAVFVLVAQRLRVLRGPGRRAQAALLVAAASAAPAVVLLLALGSDTPARFVALLVPLGVVAGVVRSRWQRPAASELVVELRTEGATSMRERLARALGDPTLDVAYRLDDGRYVDSSGRPFELQQGPDRAVTLVTAGGEEVAALLHDPALLDEPALVESVRATAGLVLENERLAADVRAQLAEVRASRARIVAATDAERRRIERNLHDGAQQRLVTLSLTLGLAASRAAGAAESAALSRAQDELETPLAVTVEGSAGDRLPDEVELAAYFLVSEGLTNVVKHASASHAIVRLSRERAILRVAVTDDGAGGARASADSGLAGLRDRLDALDAALAVESEPGRGTMLKAEFPCGS